MFILTINVMSRAARKLALSHYQESVENRSGTEDLGSRLGFLLGNSGVIAVNAVIAHDAGDSDACQAGGHWLQ